MLRGLPKVTQQVMEQPGLVSKTWDIGNTISSSRYQLSQESVLSSLSSKLKANFRLFQKEEARKWARIHPVSNELPWWFCANKNFQAVTLLRPM